MFLLKNRVARKPCALAGVAVIANVITSPVSQEALETVVVCPPRLVPVKESVIIVFVSVVLVTVTVTSPLVVC